jgi:ABC-type iron transport system FetAB ATPase subunit
MYTAKDYDRALLSPTSVFDRPMDVVATDSMTATQKLEVLKRWEDDARQLEIALAENMSGGESSKLADVRAAIDLLVSLDGVQEKAA